MAMIAVLPMNIILSACEKAIADYKKTESKENLDRLSVAMMTALIKIEVGSDITKSIDFGDKLKTFTQNQSILNKFESQ